MATIEITSAGRLSQLLQRHPSEIRLACQELGVVPAYRLNNVPYYGRDECERLGKYFREGTTDRDEQGQAECP